jgi:hypothetical protein
LDTGSSFNGVSTALLLSSVHRQAFVQISSFKSAVSRTKRRACDRLPGAFLESSAEYLPKKAYKS